RHVDLHPLRNRRRIDVDMYDRSGFFEEMLGIAYHAVVETRPDREQHVAVLHGHVRFVGAVHAEHAEEMAVDRRKTTEPHQRIRARQTQEAHEARKLRGCVAQYHAAPGVHHGTLGTDQRLYRLLDLPRMPFDDRVVRTHGHL